jgi:hypothetical protein
MKMGINHRLAVLLDKQLFVAMLGRRPHLEGVVMIIRIVYDDFFVSVVMRKELLKDVGQSNPELVDCRLEHPCILGNQVQRLSSNSTVSGGFFPVIQPHTYLKPV